MGFRQGSYCTVWSVDPGKTNNYCKARISINRKNKETGEYEQEFSGYVMMIGHANALAQKLHERDRIKLGEVDVTTTYDKAAKREYVNYKCFDFEMANGTGSQPYKSAEVDSNPVEDDDEPPF